MSSSTLTPVPHDGRMDASQPRFGGPTRRRSFTPAQKLDHVAAYEAALAQGGGGVEEVRQVGLAGPDPVEELELGGGVVAVVAGDLTDMGPVLLLNVRTVVLVR